MSTDEMSTSAELQKRFDKWHLAEGQPESGDTLFDIAEDAIDSRRDIEQLYREEHERACRLREVIELILPMAKGYAHVHQVGSNAEYIKAAEDALLT